jgi:hypothetical protein
MFSDTRVWLLAPILALMSCGPFVASFAKAEEDEKQSLKMPMRSSGRRFLTGLAIRMAT